MNRRTGLQARRILKGANALGMNGEALREECRKVTGKDSLHDLTREAADRFIVSLGARVKELTSKAPPKKARASKTTTPKDAPATNAAPPKEASDSNVVLLEIPPEAKGDRITQPQMDFIQSLLERLRTEGGWDSERIHGWWDKHVKVEYLIELSKKQASGVIAALLKMVDFYRK